MENLTIEQANIKAINSYEVLIKDYTDTINSETLFGKNDVIFIQHQDSIYCLRRTRNGKLILNK